jgi:hypothetical protein
MMFAKRRLSMPATAIMGVRRLRTAHPCHH